MVQFRKRFWIYNTRHRGQGRLSPYSALKAANLKEVMDGEVIEYELKEFRGREVATDIKVQR